MALGASGLVLAALAGIHRKIRRARCPHRIQATFDWWGDMGVAKRVAYVISKGGVRPWPFPLNNRSQDDGDGAEMHFISRCYACDICFCA